MNNAASLPNLDQLQESSDPDYNLTLTPDMVFGMRQVPSVTGIPPARSGFQTAQLQAIAPQLQQQPQGDQQRPVQTPPNSPDR